MSVITQSVITRVITGYLLHFHRLSWNYIRKHKRRNYHDDNNRIPSKPMRHQGRRDFYGDNKFDMEKKISSSLGSLVLVSFALSNVTRP